MAATAWEQVNKERVLRARSWYYMHIFADPNDAKILSTFLTHPFMKSIDGGKSFSRVRVPHGDNHYLWINPDDSDWMINANDGGANVSFNGGAIAGRARTISQPRSFIVSTRTTSLSTGFTAASRTIRQSRSKAVPGTAALDAMTGRFTAVAKALTWQWTQKIRAIPTPAATWG